MKEKKLEVEMKKEPRKAEPVHTGDLDRAIERIYQRYGSDLQAFFRDAKEALLKRQHLEPDRDELRLL